MKVREIAEHFDVPIELAQLRITEFATLPAMTTTSSFMKRSLKTWASLLRA